MGIVLRIVRHTFHQQSSNQWSIWMCVCECECEVKVMKYLYLIRAHYAILYLCYRNDVFLLTQSDAHSSTQIIRLPRRRRCLWVMRSSTLTCNEKWETHIINTIKALFIDWNYKFDWEWDGIGIEYWLGIKTTTFFLLKTALSRCELRSVRQKDTVRIKNTATNLYWILEYWECHWLISKRKSEGKENKKKHFILMCNVLELLFKLVSNVKSINYRSQ